MATCQECHHLPSGRFNAAGRQCYCECHDVADAAPERLEAIGRALAAVKDSHKLAMAQMQFAQTVIHQLERQLAARGESRERNADAGRPPG